MSEITEQRRETALELFSMVEIKRALKNKGFFISDDIYLLVKRREVENWVRNIAGEFRIDERVLSTIVFEELDKMILKDVEQRRAL